MSPGSPPPPGLGQPPSAAGPGARDPEPGAGRAAFRRGWAPSLRTQLIVGVTAVHLLLVAALTYEVAERQRVFLARQSLDETEGLARLLALNASSWVLANDVVGLGEIVSALRGHPELRYATVATTGGKVLAHTDPTRVGLYLDDGPSRAVLAGPARMQVVHRDEALLDVAGPVFSSTGECIAWVRIGEGQEAITRNLAAVRRDGVVFGLLAALLGAAFAATVGFRLTSRIRGLLVVSQGVRAGRTDLRANLAGGDELAELGAGFDSMLDGIQERERENARLEAELLHAQRLESVGRLAGGVAHDFNNLLTAIVGNSQLVLDKLPPGDQRTCVQEIMDAGLRATEVTRGLLAFSRKQLFKPARLDLREVVRGFDGLLARLIGEDIQVSSRVPDQPLEIMGNRGQLEQVLMNLGTNARDAMPGGGTLAIEVTAVEFGDAEVAARGLHGGRHALITVRDSGCGMDAPTRARIFDPFFTTKELGKGTGLGLSMAYGILRQHDGFIEVQSVPGHGSAFMLYLPLAPALPPGEAREELAGADQGRPDLAVPPASWAGAPGGGSRPSLAAPAPAGARRGETILLAEDDVTLRTFATRVLRGAGYGVLPVADGEEAVLRFAEHRNEISLCLLDLVMPRRSGRSAYQEILRLSPRVPVVFASGYTSETAFQGTSPEEEAAMLRKPYLPAELLARVRQELDGTTASG